MTNEREQLWSAVDDALDARRDPCESTFVQEWIADHPEDADDLARVLRGVEVVGRTRPRAPRKLVPVIAAVALVELGALLWTRAPRHVEPSQSPPHSLSRVVSFSIEVTRESEGRITTVRTQPDHVERSQISRLGSTLIVSSLESRYP